MSHARNFGLTHYRRRAVMDEEIMNIALIVIGYFAFIAALVWATNLGMGH